MRALVEFRNDAHPLKLIAIWSLLEAATIALVATLPGDPFYAESGMGSLGQAVVVTAVLMLFVLVGSRIGWYVAIFSDTVALALPIVVLLMGFQLKPIIVAVFSAAALWLIWSGSIERHVTADSRSRNPQLH